MPSDRQPITVQLRIDGLPKSPNQTKGLHWSKLEKEKKEWMEKVRFAALEVKQRERLRGLYESCTIHFHISVGDNRRHDPDNLLWACSKPTLDALTGLLIEDDNFEQIRLSFSFDRESPRGYLVTITGY